VDGVILENAYDLELAGKEYRVFATSWNGMGGYALFDDTVRVLEEKSETVHPCLPTGFDDVTGAGTIFSGFKGTGSSDYQGCVALMTEIFEDWRQELCDYSFCGLGGQYIPNIADRSLFTTSTWKYNVKGLIKGGYDISEEVTAKNIQGGAEWWCGKSLSELEVQDGYYGKFDIGRCMPLVAEALILESGYGDFSTSTVTNNPPGEKGFDPEWTAGLLIATMSEMYMEREEPELASCIMSDKKWTGQFWKYRAGSIKDCFHMCNQDDNSMPKKCKGWSWVSESQKPCRLYTQNRRKKSKSGFTSGKKNCHPFEGKLLKD